MSVRRGLAALTGAALLVTLTAVPAAAESKPGTTTCGGSYSAGVRSRTQGYVTHEYHTGRLYAWNLSESSYTVKYSSSGVAAANWLVVAKKVDFAQTYGLCQT
jgi:hypothetical protein